MCGRFVLLTDLSTVIDHFNVDDIQGKYITGNNISPGQDIVAIVRKDGKNHLTNFKWGLVPQWAKDASIGRKLFNARGETLLKKPSFRDAFIRRRCAIVADGFYEWPKKTTLRSPLYISLQSGNPMLLAGLFEIWTSPENNLTYRSCTIVTTEANNLIKPFHDRMPVIIPPAQMNIWLDSSHRDLKALMTMLRPYHEGQMKIEDAHLNLDRRD